MLVKYSKENQALAAMIQDDKNYQLSPQKPSKSLDKIRNADPKDLLPRMGVLTTVDKNGQSIVLAYGQSEIRKTSSRQSAAESRAFSQAANIARDNLKNFVAQDIALEEITENAEVLSSYADGSQDFFSQNKIVSYANPIDCIEDHIYKFDVEPLRYSADHLGLKFNGSWSKYEIAIVWNETNKIINLSLNEIFNFINENMV